MKRRWESIALRRLGETVYWERASAEAVDQWGDIISGSPTTGTFRAVVEKIDMRFQNSDIGGIPLDEKSCLKVWTKGNQDVRVGDSFNWPYQSTQFWIVDNIIPERIDNVNIFNLCIAFRDGKR